MLLSITLSDVYALVCNFNRNSYFGET